MIAMWLLHFCEWCNSSWWGVAIRKSQWLFPFVEIFHLLALGILGGTVLMLNLRLMRLAFRNQDTAEMAEEMKPWMISSLIVMLISGFLLFSTEAVKMYGNWGFQLKMLFLLLASLYTFTIYGRIVRRDDGRFGPALRIAVALLSLLLWSGVGLGGRSLGYITTTASSVDQQ
jgi:hypothetical protein